MQRQTIMRTGKQAARLGMLLTAAVLAMPAQAQDAQDPIVGQKLFRQRCASCHWIVDKPGRLTKSGPPLAGLFGRVAGTYPGFSEYSSGLVEWGKTWTPAALDTYIADPKTIAANTSMRIGYAGVRNSQDRAHIIAYLKLAASDPKAD